MMNKEFKLIPTRDSLVGETDVKKLSEYSDVVPAVNALPQWYKDLAPYDKGTKHSLKEIRPINNKGSDGTDTSTKLCGPFLDAMTSGYIYRLPEDVTVDLSEKGAPILSWNKVSNLLDMRGVVDNSVPEHCHPIQFGWRMQAYYLTPEGYSTLICHPFNRPELPFYVPAAIVDSDVWGLAGFIPFYLKRNFIGTIEKGTPLFQMLPIKRDNWELKYDTSLEALEQEQIKEEKRRIKISHYYRDYIWKKKKY
jgi:hypothetical protein